MTTLTLTGVDAITSGNAITISNTSPALAGVSISAGKSAVTADSATVPSGFSGNGAKLAWGIGGDTTGAAADMRVTLPSTGQAASNVFRLSVYYRTATPTPGADISVLYAYQGGNRALTLTQRSANAGFRILDGNGSGTAFDLTGTYAWNTWYRIEIQADNTGGPGASKLVVNVYNMGGTLVGSYSNTTTANLGVGTGTFNQFRLGATGYNATAGSHGFFGVRWADTGTGDIGVFAPALSTPTVTPGTVVNPTVVAGTNGTAVATWPAVANAVSYEALLAPTATPQQSDFTHVASGVTSPYTFTGLGGSAYAVGIRAKAS